ncbi:MAG: hypothetical protein LBM77_11905 [Spirochaetaceae bacterium]|jgi:hypothetical protein|nr:hypothetical protein [Spirochaetaceae bacterium]
MINLKKRLSGIVALSAIILSSCASMQDFAMRQTPDFIGGFLPCIL